MRGSRVPGPPGDLRAARKERGDPVAAMRRLGVASAAGREPRLLGQAFLVRRVASRRSSHDPGNTPYDSRLGNQKETTT